MTKVSIIVPVYNVEQYLKKCLDSLVNQTLKDIEIIIINDGSPDHSQDIIDEYCKKYSNIKSYIKENGGQASARNMGINVASGEYLTFVDSDDWIDLTFCEKLYLQAINKMADIVTCNAYKVENEHLLPFNLNVAYSDDKFKNYLVNQASPWGKLIKRNLIIENNLYFLVNHIYEDLAIIPAYALFANNIIHLDEHLYYYLIRSGSTMKQTKYNLKLVDIFDSIQYLEDIFKKNNKDKEYADELCYLYIEHLLHAAYLRFLDFNNKEAKQARRKIIKIIKNKYPNWSKKESMKLFTKKEKLILKLFYYHLSFIYTIYTKMR